MKLRSSLSDRPLLFGALISLAWHFFWFFSVTITVGPSETLRRRATRTVSLGAVLDDAIFKTLVESRPQVTEAFYRHMSDFAPVPAEPDLPMMERHVSGDVVSVPFGKKFITSLKEFMDGDKPSADFDLGGFGAAFRNSETLEGEVKDRPVLSRPPRPEFPAKSEVSLRGAEVVVGFSVDSLGMVIGAEMIVSSEDPVVDALWLDYIRGFRFSPSAAVIQKGKTRLRLR